MLEFVARFLCLLPIGRRQHASHVLRTRVFLRQALMRFSSAGDSARDTFDVSLSFPFSVSSLIIPSAAVAPLSNDFCLFCFSGLLHLQNLKRIVVRVHVTSTLVFFFIGGSFFSPLSCACGQNKQRRVARSLETGWRNQPTRRRLLFITCGILLDASSSVGELAGRRYNRPPESDEAALVLRNVVSFLFYLFFNFSECLRPEVADGSLQPSERFVFFVFFTEELFLH